VNNLLISGTVSVMQSMWSMTKHG